MEIETFESNFEINQSNLKDIKTKLTQNVKMRMQFPQTKEYEDIINFILTNDLNLEVNEILGILNFCAFDCSILFILSYLLSFLNSSIF